MNLTPYCQADLLHEVDKQVSCCVSVQNGLFATADECLFRHAISSWIGHTFSISTKLRTRVPQNVNFYFKVQHATSITERDVFAIKFPSQACSCAYSTTFLGKWLHFRGFGRCDYNDLPLKNPKFLKSSSCEQTVRPQNLSASPFGLYHNVTNFS